MTSRSWGSSIARAASRARSTSCWLTSRCFPDTATAPRLLTPRMWPPAMPVTTAPISALAISSASRTACLIDSTVESMLTTTPLRRPRHGLMPTPTTSSSPSGDHSAITQQDLVVPTSSPATTWRTLVLAIVPSLASLEHDLIAKAQIDGAHRLAGRLELRQHALEPSEARLPLLPAEVHLDPVQRVEHGALDAAHVDLRDRREQGGARALEQPQQRDADGGTARGLRTARPEIVGLEAADDRRVERDGARLRPQVDAVLVDPVEVSGVHERERATLLDDDVDAVRQRAHDRGPADRRQRLHAPRDVPRVQREDVGPRRDT